MFRHLLVPLDGSRLPEAALPAAALLAGKLGAAVTLVHVIEENPPQDVHGESHLRDPDQACTYLDEVASRAFPHGSEVETHTHRAQVQDVARSIVEHTAELEPDLIVMCTHGQGGLYTRLFGSIAQQIIALGRTPVLLVRPSQRRAAPELACQRMLVPLDGNPDHEQGLRVAAGLAQACGADLHLVMVVPTVRTLRGQQAASGVFLPGAVSTLLDLDREAAEAHLSDQVVRLRADGLAVTAEVRRGDPARVIARMAQRAHADLVVMGTHGKAGMEAFWSDSVAAAVSSEADVPLLLVPVRG
jgi:nucleotide-binding universal stress UspA family protein